MKMNADFVSFDMFMSGHISLVKSMKSYTEVSGE